MAKKKNSEEALDETQATGATDDAGDEGDEGENDVIPSDGGIPDPEIARVKNALDPRDENPVPSRGVRRAALEEFVVQPCAGELQHNGKKYAPGKTVLLDQETAKSLGDAVQAVEK